MIEGLRLNWPKRMREHTLTSSYKEFETELADGVEDKTTVAGPLLRYFAPRVSLFGRELWLERKSRIWRGVQFRATVTKNDNKLRACLQYLFIYGKQAGVFSVLSMLGPTLFLLIWTRVLDNFIFDYYLLIVVTYVVGFPLVFVGLRSFPGELERRALGLPSRPLFRADLYYLVLGLSAFLVLFEFDIGIIMYSFFLSFVVLLMLLEYFEILPWVHNMDYVPVFIWIETDFGSGNNVESLLNQPESWSISKACWDDHHYATRSRTPSELTQCEGQTINLSEKRIQLKTDNKWHSLSCAKEWVENPRTSLGNSSLLIILMILLSAEVILLYISPELYESNYPWSGSAFILIVFLLVIVGSHRFHYPLVRDRGFEGWDYMTGAEIATYHLDREKLLTLWNLDDEEARLEIKSKMQDPFNSNPEFFKSFRDPGDE